MFGAPFRLYWRRDAQLLARLALDGRALFRLAVRRGARAATLAVGPCALAALAFWPIAEPAIALRHLALAGVAWLMAAALAPAAALSAGAIVASDRAQALVQSLGEASAPKTAWLGLLPGLAATAMALLLIAAAPWAAGVAALDQERLAHIDRSTASPLERGWSALVARAPGARLVFDKDARLSRRRYPIPYFVGVVGVLVLWGIAAFGSAGSLGWAYALLGGLAAYAVVMARRLEVPPIEHPAFLATLAIAPGEVAAGKRAAVALRVLVTCVLGGAPLVARAADPLETAAVVAAVSAAALVVGLRAIAAGEA
jgi:hypothetical protein